MNWIDQMVHLIVNSARVSLNRGTTMNYEHISGSTQGYAEKSGYDNVISTGSSTDKTPTLSALETLGLRFGQVNDAIDNLEAKLDICLRQTLKEASQTGRPQAVPESALVSALTEGGDRLDAIQARIISIANRVTL